MRATEPWAENGGALDVGVQASQPTPDAEEGLEDDDWEDYELDESLDEDDLDEDEIEDWSEDEEDGC
jgi:hypothetical protein